MPSSETFIGSSNVKLPTSRSRSHDSRLQKDRERSNDSPYDVIDDTRPKTRRVNPERLATRLDPRLVAEMDALIVPGAKMPNFSVRKDLQERYCVDRRHIYDYFHSRGLRVAKEDKHNNLLKGRLLKARSQTSMTTGHNGGVTKLTTKDQTKTMLGKAKSTRLQNVVDMEHQNYHDINTPLGPLTTPSAVARLPLSPGASFGLEEHASLNVSHEPSLATISDVPDVSTCSHAELETTNLSMNSLYSFYGEYQTSDLTLSMPSTVFGFQGLTLPAEEFASFVQEDHLGYYDLTVFAQDGSFNDNFGQESWEKIATHYGNSKGEPIISAGGPSCCLETKPRDSKVQSPESVKLVARGESEVDFSKWLLAVDLQDDKDGHIGISTEQLCKFYTMDPSPSHITDSRLCARELVPNFPQGY